MGWRSQLRQARATSSRRHAVVCNALLISQVSLSLVISETDRADSAKVIVVNESFARRFWPNQHPIGKHVALGRQAPSEVVGVVISLHSMNPPASDTMGV